MAITLAQAKVGMSDKVDQQVIDEFRRASFLLDSLIFDNAISPGTGGSTLTYGYVQLLSPSTAGVRQINAEYTPNEAERKEATAKAIIMGGSFAIDRVIAETDGAVDEVSFQMKQKVKATANEFHNLVVNGTAAASGSGYVTNTFNGLKKLLAGSDTEILSTVDLSTSALLDANYQAFLDEIDEWLQLIDGKPTAMIMNSKMVAKMRSVARRAGYYERTKDDFGRTVESYNGIPFFEGGEYYNFTSKATISVVPVEADGTTAIYAYEVALDGFHGISPAGDKIMSQRMPDFAQAGAVKEGDVEFVAGIVLKNSRKAAVLKGIKVKPTA